MHSQSSGGDGVGGFDGTGEAVGEETTSSPSPTLLTISSVFWTDASASEGSDVSVTDSLELLVTIGDDVWLDFTREVDWLLRAGRSTLVSSPHTNPLYHLTHCFEAKSNKSPDLHSRAYLNTPSRQTLVDLQSGVGTKPVWPDGQVPFEETFASSYRTTVATSSSVVWPFSSPEYSAVQTSQNRSRMSEETPPLPPLPPLPHCVAVEKYRQKV